MKKCNKKLKYLKVKDDYFRYEFEPEEKNDCFKLQYNKSKAKKAARELTHKFGYNMKIYKCDKCGVWHTTKQGN